MPGDPIRARSGIAAPVVALTFDDGPAPWTEPILDELERHGGHGTFFVLGDAIERADGGLSCGGSSTPVMTSGTTRTATPTCRPSTMIGFGWRWCARVR